MSDWKVGVGLKLALTELPPGAMREAVRTAIAELGYNRQPAPADLLCTLVRGDGKVCNTPLRYGQYVLESRALLGHDVDGVTVISDDYEMVAEDTRGDHLYCPECFTEYQMPEAVDFNSDAEEEEGFIPLVAPWKEG